jgi:hypothetical protein
VLKRTSAGSLAAQNGKELVAAIIGQSRQRSLGWLAIASAELRAAAMLLHTGAAAKVLIP